MASNADIIRDLTRVKATFQLRAIETVIRGEPSRFVFISEDTRRVLYPPKGA